MGLEHKSELRLYRELKKEVGFEKYLQYVKGANARLFLKFCWEPMDFLRSWVGLLVGMGHRNVLTVGPLKSPLSMHVLFDCASYDSRDKNILPS